jgi:hypothetical protein
MHAPTFPRRGDPPGTLRVAARASLNETRRSGASPTRDLDPSSSNAPLLSGLMPAGAMRTLLLTFQPALNSRGGHVQAPPARAPNRRPRPDEHATTLTVENPPEGGRTHSQRRRPRTTRGNTRGAHVLAGVRWGGPPSIEAPGGSSPFDKVHIILYIFTHKVLSFGVWLASSTAPNF